MFFELIAQPVFVEKAKEIEQIVQQTMTVAHDKHQASCNCCNCLVEHAQTSLDAQNKPLL